MAQAEKILVGELESLPPVRIYQVVLTMTESEAKLLVEAAKDLEGSSVSSTISELSRAVDSHGTEPVYRSSLDHIEW